MTRRAVLADIRPLPVVPTVRPADREGKPALVTAPTEADRRAWAVAALHSMHRIGGMPERAPRMPWGWIAGALLAVAALGMAGTLASPQGESVRHELRIPR